METQNAIQGGHPHATYPVTIDGKPYHFNQSNVTSLDILEKANKNPPDCYSVYKGLEGCDFELIRPDQVIDLREIGRERFLTKAPVIFNYLLNSEPETTDLAQMTPLQFMQRAAVNPEKEYLVQLFEDKPDQIYAWSPEEVIDMICRGMQFVTRPWLELADIELLGKTCQPVPVAKKYKVKIQNQYHLLNTPFLSREEAIRLGGKTEIEKWDVLMFLSNQADPEKLSKGQVVNLQRPCIVYFVLQPKQQIEGKEVRRQFPLPGADQDFLNLQGLPWEALHTPLGYCVIIHDFPVPQGYNVDKVLVGLIIPPNYPANQIDMAYFSPALHLNSGRQIRAITQCNIDGRVFQRWSRHRAPGEWTPGVDSIATHLQLVKNWFLKELNP